MYCRHSTISLQRQRPPLTFLRLCHFELVTIQADDKFVIPTSTLICWYRLIVGFEFEDAFCASNAKVHP